MAHTSPTSAFARLHAQPADSLLRLIAEHRDDPRPGKIDLGVGVYRDAGGGTPLMRAIKEAEHRLWSTQDTKSYLGPEGDEGFVDSLAKLVFGETLADDARITGVQTPGGTGALRLAAELLARSHPDARIWIGTPTWPNHAPIFRDAGLKIAEHAFFDSERGDIDFDGMMAGLNDAARGDIVLLHGCCHNPTGTGFTAEQWDAVIALMAERGLLPVIDLAYHGLGAGLDADAAGLRRVLEQLPSVIVAYSCDKNFALYRERVGALWVQANTADDATLVRQNLLVLARHLWSMPPDHGAAAVRIVLSNADLTAMWRDELVEMQGRLNGLRQLLAQAHPRLAPIGRQQGMFALLPLTPADIAGLRADHAIYMAGNGRINIAGLTDSLVPQFVDAILPMISGRGPG